MNETHPHSAWTLAHLRAGGVSLVVDLSNGALPSVVYWGNDLGPLTEPGLAALKRALMEPLAQNGPDVAVRLAVVPEPHAGWLGLPGIEGTRGDAAWSPCFRVRSRRLDDRELEVDADDPDAGLALNVLLRLDASGVLAAQAALTNTADTPFAVQAMRLALPVPRRASEILDFGGRWARERIPQRRHIATGLHLRENRKGRTGLDSATLLHLGTPGFDFDAGEVWAVHVAWSGNHHHYAERLWTDDQVIGGGELLLPGEIRLGPGERYQTPELFAVYSPRGLDEVAGRLHRLVRSRPTHPVTPRPVTLNSWGAVKFAHDEDKLVQLAERAAKAGVERFVLDDGWFGGRRNETAGLGDWVVSRAVWPAGLHILADRVRDLGMQFGLWFEPEMVNPDSELAREHPEWIMAATPSRLPVTSRHQLVLNLADRRCYEHILDQMSAIAEEYRLDYIKWDHNRDLIEAGDRRTGRPIVHRQTEAAYRMMDELRSRHPWLEIEACSSGGGRVDLEMAKHAQRFWVSDCLDPLETLDIFRWTLQLVPPEMIGVHIEGPRSHATGRVSPLSFRATAAMFGSLGVEWDLTTTSEQDLAELAWWISLHKSLRPLLHGGRTIRRAAADGAVSVHGVVAPDRLRAVFGIYATHTSEFATFGPVSLPGLSRQHTYRLSVLEAPGAAQTAAQPVWRDEPLELTGAQIELTPPSHFHYYFLPSRCCWTSGASTLEVPTVTTRPSPLDESTRAVLLFVLRNGPIARAELARRTHLSAPTLSRLTKQLLHAGLLQELEPSLQGAGRPSVPLDIISESRYFVGCNVADHRLTSVLTNFRGEILDDATYALAQLDPASVVEVIAQAAARFRESTGHVTAIGVGVGGSVDDNASNGVVRKAPIIGWRNVPLGKRVEQRTGIHCIVENDVNALAHAEHWFGVGRGMTTFAVVTVGTGVGCGIIANDALVRGRGGAAGSVGHLPLKSTGPSCERRHVGCARAILTVDAITRAISDVRRQSTSFEDCLDLYARGDVVARTVIDDAAYHLGVLVGMVANVVGPEGILVTGDGVGYALLARPSVQAGFRATQHWTSERLDVRIQPFAFTEWARGAATVAIQASTTGALSA